VLIDNKPWDIAPGLVFAKEFGFIAEQFSGSRVDLGIHSQNIIVAPERVFGKIAKSIRGS
jgi:fructose-1,6-bisphosphatase/inositol monophosphatase family enzyme